MDIPIWFADVTRTIAIITGGGAMSAALIIAYRYEVAYRRMKKAGTEKGLLPRHVRNISVCHCIALGWLLVEVLHRVGSELSWRSTVLIFLSCFTMYALSDVAKHSHRKVKETTTATTTTTDTVN